MPSKMTKSILRPPFRPPQVPAAVRSSRLPCGKVGKAQIFTAARESSGESLLIAGTSSNFPQLFQRSGCRHVAATPSLTLCLGGGLRARTGGGQYSPHVIGSIVREASGPEHT